MKWIEVTCYVIDGKMDELGIEQEEFEIKTLLNTDKIISVREAVNEDIDGVGFAVLHLVSGASYSTKESYDEVVKMIKG